MLDRIYDLAERSVRDREEYILSFLSQNGIYHETQKFPDGKNIILPSDHRKKIIVSAHYDIRGEGTYGANDNASGVVVLQELAHRYSQMPNANIGVEFCFFDCEETQLLGSKWYIDKYGLNGLIGGYNLDMVGIGETFVVNPLFKGQQSQMYDYLKMSADQKSIWLQRVVKLHGRTSDHERFMDRGYDNITLTAFTYDEARMIQQYNEVFFEPGSFQANAILDSLPVLNDIHSPKDSPQKIEERTLQSCTDLVWDAVKIIDCSF